MEGDAQGCIISNRGANLFDQEKNYSSEKDEC
jgi:hypothetical protein